MRRTIISGRIANFGRRYIPAEDDKGAFAIAFVNVSMDKKDEETGYTETKPMKILANGWLADRLNNFEANEYIYLEGKLEVENDYTSKETGELIKGGWIVRVDYIDNWGSKQSSNSKPETHKSTATAPKKGGATANKKLTGKGIKMPSRAKKTEA